MERYMTLDEVLGIIPFSRQELTRKAKRGDFPRPIKIGARSIAFKESAIREWLENRPEAWTEKKAPTV